MIFESDDDLKTFITNNLLTTMEVAEMLNCSRQYIDKLVKSDKLTPVKQTQRDKLFLKSDIIARLKPSE